MEAKQAKRLERLLKSIDRTLKLMDHADVRDLVHGWNGPRNVRENLAEFADWQAAKLARSKT